MFKNFFSRNSKNNFNLKIKESVHVGLINKITIVKQNLKKIFIQIFDLQ